MALQKITRSQLRSAIREVLKEQMALAAAPEAWSDMDVDKESELASAFPGFHFMSAEVNAPSQVGWSATMDGINFPLMGELEAVWDENAQGWLMSFRDEQDRWFDASGPDLIAAKRMLMSKISRGEAQ